MFPFPAREVSRAESILLKMLKAGYFVPAEYPDIEGKVFHVYHSGTDIVDSIVSVQTNPTNKTIVVTGWVNDDKGNRNFRASMQIDDDVRQARTLQFMWGFPYFHIMKETEKNPRIMFPSS